MNKLFLSIGVLFILIFLAGCQTETKSDFEIKKMTYGYVISAYNGKDGEVTIPSKINGKKIVGIGKSAFAYNDNIIHVKIPLGITRIEDGAFQECAKIEDITLPETVNYIGDYVFYGLPNLKTIDIPASVENLGNAFSKNLDLQSINVSVENKNYSSIDGVLFDKNQTILLHYPEAKEDETYIIPETVEKFTSTAFNLSKIGVLTLNNKITIIPDYAFLQMMNLREINIPKSVISIGNSVFQYCDHLEAINVEGGNGSYISFDGVLYSADLSTLIKFPAGKKMNYYLIPFGVKLIEQNAFQNALIDGITLPDTLEEIRDGAFSHTILKSIIIPGSVHVIGNYAFSGDTSLQSVILAEGVAQIASMAFSECDQLTTITLPNSVNTIAENAFFKDKQLKTIQVMNMNPFFKSIDGVLYNKSGSILLIYPNGKEDFTFSVPDSVTQITAQTFEDTYVRELTLPASIEFIGNYGLGNSLDLLTIHAKTPPKVDGVLGLGETTTVYVPRGHKSDYLNDEVWSKYVNLKEQ